MKTVDALKLWTHLVQDDPATFPDETRDVLFTINIAEPGARAKVGSFVGGWNAEAGFFYGLAGGWNTKHGSFIGRKDGLIISPDKVGKWRYFPLPEIDYPTEPLEPMG